MLRIWFKVLKDEHIVKQLVYEREERFTYAHFFDYLSEACTELDIPTPVLLKPHLFNYAKFNHVNFVARDFLEEIEFDKLVLENIL